MENMRDLIAKAKQFAPQEECQRLAESFEEFMELYYQRDAFRGDREFALRLEAAHQKFWASFNQAAGHCGITPEWIRDHIRNNPVILAAKQEAIGAAMPAEQKLRKNHKKVKI